MERQVRSGLTTSHANESTTAMPALLKVFICLKRREQDKTEVHTKSKYTQGELIVPEEIQMCEDRKKTKVVTGLATEGEKLPGPKCRFPMKNKQLRKMKNSSPLHLLPPGTDIFTLNLPKVVNICIKFIPTSDHESVS